MPNAINRYKPIKLDKENDHKDNNRRRIKVHKDRFVTLPKSETVWERLSKVKKATSQELSASPSKSKSTLNTKSSHRLVPARQYVLPPGKKPLSPARANTNKRVTEKKSLKRIKSVKTVSTIDDVSENVVYICEPVKTVNEILTARSMCNSKSSSEDSQRSAMRMCSQVESNHHFVTYYNPKLDRNLKLPYVEIGRTFSGVVSQDSFEDYEEAPLISVPTRTSINRSAIITHNFQNLLDRQNSSMNPEEIKIIKELVQTDERHRLLGTDDGYLFRDILKTQLREVKKRELVLESAISKLDPIIDTEPEKVKIDKSFDDISYKVNTPMSSKVTTKPSSKLTIPTLKATVPTSKATIPLSKATVPASKASIPLWKASMPASKASIPLTKATVPAFKATTMSSKATKPTPSLKSAIKSSKSTITLPKEYSKANESTSKTTLSTVPPSKGALPVASKVTLPSSKTTLVTSGTTLTSSKANLETSTLKIEAQSVEKSIVFSDLSLPTKQQVDVVFKNVPSLEKEIIILKALGEKLEATLKRTVSDRSLKAHKCATKAVATMTMKYIYEFSWLTTECNAESKVIIKGVKQEHGFVHEYRIANKTIVELKEDAEQQFYIPINSEQTELQSTCFSKMKENPDMLLRHLKQKSSLVPFSILEQDPIFFNNFIMRNTRDLARIVQKETEDEDDEDDDLKALTSSSVQAVSTVVAICEGGDSTILKIQCHDNQTDEKEFPKNNLTIEEVDNKPPANSHPTTVAFINKTNVIMNDIAKATTVKDTDDIFDDLSTDDSFINEIKLLNPSATSTPKKVINTKTPAKRAPVGFNETRLQPSTGRNRFNRRERVFQQNLKRHRSHRSKTPMPYHKNTEPTKNKLLKTILIGTVQISIFIILIMAITYPDIKC